MKKVAFVLPYYAHYRSAMIEELLNDRMIEYHFIGDNNTGRSYHSLKTYFFDDSNFFHKTKNIWLNKYFLWQVGLLKHLMKLDYDAVIFFGDWKHLSSWLAVFYLKIIKTPCYFWGHGFLKKESGLNGALKLKFMKTFNKGGFLFSHRSKNLLLECGYSKPLHVVYNSLDFDIQQRIKDAYLENQEADRLFDNPYIIFSGRLIPEKKLGLLVQSLKVLIDQGTSVSAVIIGSGPEEAALAQLTKDLGVADNVLFYGATYNEEVLAQLYLNSEACVFPGAIGLTTIHSMSYGVPVITHNNLDEHGPEVEAIKDKINGFLFTQNNLDSLVTVLSNYLKASKSDKETIKRNAIEEVRKYYTPQNQARIFTSSVLGDLDRKSS